MSLHSGFRLHKSIPKWTVAYENIDLIEEYGQTDIEEAMALYNESAASFFFEEESMYYRERGWCQWRASLI
jgi:hypothetical protein